MADTDATSRAAQAPKALVRRLLDTAESAHGLLVVLGPRAVLRNLSAVGAIFVAVVLLVIGVGGAGVVAVTGAEREFLLAEAGERVVLTLVSTGASSGLKHTYRLYGDGRLEMRLETVDGQLRDGRELYLSRGEAEALVGILVDTGVLECDSEELKARFRETAGSVPSLPDSGTLTLTVNLDRYVSATGVETDFEHSLSFQDARANLGLFERSSLPTFSELEGLAELQQSLYANWKLARQREEP